MAIFPTMEEYFIVAQKGTPFIKEMIEAIEKLFYSYWRFKNRHFRLNNLSFDKTYDQYFYLASQIVLQKRQTQIDQTNKNSYR